jgi:hypothetical protein
MLANILRPRASDIMWQKARLLNLAIATLPGARTKIAWLDGDLLFVDPSWFERRAAALEDVPVPQPVETVVGSPCVDCAFGRASCSRNYFESWAADVESLVRGQERGAWAWQSSKSAMHDWASRFLDLRLEDATARRSGLESSAQRIAPKAGGA